LRVQPRRNHCARTDRRAVRAEDCGAPGLLAHATPLQAGDRAIPLRAFAASAYDPLDLLG
jgi:hypothetical protein